MYAHHKYIVVTVSFSVWLCVVNICSTHITTCTWHEHEQSPAVPVLAWPVAHSHTHMHTCVDSHQMHLAEREQPPLQILP